MTGAHAKDVPCRQLAVICMSAALVSLTGCAALSTGASLVVDVEVYNGPLTMSVPSQSGETLGLLDGAMDAFRNYISAFGTEFPASRADLYDYCKAFETRMRAKTDPPEDPQGVAAQVDLCFETARIERKLRGLHASFERLAKAQKSLQEVMSKAVSELQEATNDSNVEVQTAANRGIETLAEAAASLDTAVEERSFRLVTTNLNNRLQQDVRDSSNTPKVAEVLERTAKAVSREGISAPEPENAKQPDNTARYLPEPDPLADLSQIVSVTSFLRDRALYWSAPFIATSLTDRPARGRLAAFQHLAGYYANLIEVRAELIAKQGGHNGERRIERNRLPTSDYLKDASATEYLSLHSWYNASKQWHLPGGRHFGPELGQTPDGLSVEDRIRSAKTLFASRYWSQVNEVYASGQGETRMALIKDDIGNWSLKSFDSNPEELLSAYREATLAGLQTVVRLAKKSTAPEGGVLEFAGELSRGRIGSGQALANVDEGIRKTRADTRTSIDAIQAQFVAQRDALDKAVATAEEQMATKQKEANTALENVQAKQADLTKATVRRDDAIAEPASAERIAQLKAEALQLERELLDLKLKQAELQKGLDTAQSETTAAKERRRIAGDRALEAARNELRSHRRAIAAIREVSSPAVEQQKDAGASPATSK